MRLGWRNGGISKNSIQRKIVRAACKKVTTNLHMTKPLTHERYQKDLRKILRKFPGSIANQARQTSDVVCSAALQEVVARFDLFSFSFSFSFRNTFGPVSFQFSLFFVSYFQSSLFTVGSFRHACWNYVLDWGVKITRATFRGVHKSVINDDKKTQSQNSFRI